MIEIVCKFEIFSLAMVSAAFVSSIPRGLLYYIASIGPANWTVVICLAVLTPLIYGLIFIGFYRKLTYWFEQRRKSRRNEES